MAHIIFIQSFRVQLSFDCYMLSKIMLLCASYVTRRVCWFSVARIQHYCRSPAKRQILCNHTSNIRLQFVPSKPLFLYTNDANINMRTVYISFSVFCLYNITANYQNSRMVFGQCFFCITITQLRKSAGFLYYSSAYSTVQDQNARHQAYTVSNIGYTLTYYDHSKPLYLCAIDANTHKMHYYLHVTIIFNFYSKNNVDMRLN